MIIEELEITKASGMKRLEFGFERALEEESRPGQPVKYSTDHQTELASMACGPCPEGRRRWTILLLTKELKKKQGLGKISGRQSGFS